MLKKIHGLIMLLRLPSAILMNLFIFVPLLLHYHDISFALIQTIPMLLLIMGEIALNDCCDIERDKINKPKRPLANDLLNRKQGIVIVCITLICALILALFIYSLYSIQFLIFTLLLLVLSLYNIKNSFFQMLKTFITSLSTVLALCFILTYISIPNNYLYFLASAFFFIEGRELLMDIRDFEGDSETDYCTLAVKLGCKNVFRISLVSFIVSFLISLIGLIPIWSQKVYKVLLFVIAFIFINIFVFIFYNSKIKNDNKTTANRAIILMWIPMILMLVAFFI